MAPAEPVVLQAELPEDGARGAEGMPGGAQIDEGPVVKHIGGGGARPADAPEPLVDVDVPAGAREDRRGRQSVGAGADDGGPAVRGGHDPILGRPDEGAVTPA